MKNEKKSQPGVLLYIDTFESMMEAGMTPEQLGRYMIAWINKVKTGVDPDFSDDRLLEVIWIMNEIQRNADSMRYQKKLVDSAYANFCKACQTAHVEKLDRETWEAQGMPSSPTGSPRFDSDPKYKYKYKNKSNLKYKGSEEQTQGEREAYRASETLTERDSFVRKGSETQTGDERLQGTPAEDDADLQESAVSCGTEDRQGFMAQPDEMAAQENPPLYDPESQEYQIAVFLAETIHQNFPVLREPEEAQLCAWAATIRLIHDEDGYSWNTILDAIEWAADDSFWKKVICNAETLRKKIDALLVKSGLASQ